MSGNILGVAAGSDTKANRTPRLYLHIGRNKAGSTSLQHYLARHADWLRGHNVRYGLFGHLARPGTALEGFASHHDMIAGLRASATTSLLVSNEMIFAFPDPLAAEMAADLASVNTKIILYIRPYREWVRSGYAHEIRTGVYAGDFDAYLDHIAPRISCWPGVELWSRALGWDRLHLRSTDMRDLVGGSLIQDSLAVMGLTPPSMGNERSNAAPPWMVIELLRFVGHGAASPAGWDFTNLAIAKALHEAAERAIADEGMSGLETPYLTGAQDQRLRDLYNADLDRVHAGGGPRLAPDDAPTGQERPFLPQATRIPGCILRHIVAAASAPDYARVHPELAAFLVSNRFRQLVSEADGSYFHRQRGAHSMDTGLAEKARKPNVAARAYTEAAAGNLMAAIDLATQAARQNESPDLLAALPAWRKEAYDRMSHPAGRENWPPTLPDPFPGMTGIPSVHASDLTADILGGAIIHHGCLRVKGLVSETVAAELQEGIERALAAQYAALSGGPVTHPGWYAPLELPSLTAIRKWAETLSPICGAVWTADSPPMLFKLIEVLTQSGILDHIAELMGERPALSVTKSTLRRVGPGSNHDWHQDGAFLGRNVRSVNVWLAVSSCGTQAPGMDVVARRLPYIMQTGSHGATFDWSVGPGLVDILADGGAEIATPEFAAGDALLFDHMMLHRTGGRPDMPHDRWAIESWFFAPTNYPTDQVPLLV
jgi:hypothetical protein